MSDRPAHAPSHRRHIISKSELARRAGKARSTISEALQGPLAACLVGRRVDAFHPALQTYAKDVWEVDPAVLLDSWRGEPRQTTAAPDAEHMDLDAFAAFAGVTPRELSLAVERGDLNTALFGGRVRLRSDATLAYLMHRPRITVDAKGRLAGAALPDACFADPDSAIWLASFVRLYQRMPNEAA